MEVCELECHTMQCVYFNFHRDEVFAVEKSELFTLQNPILAQWHSSPQNENKPICLGMKPAMVDCISLICYPQVSEFFNSIKTKVISWS
jgi:hypothetical protein